MNLKLTFKYSKNIKSLSRKNFPWGLRTGYSVKRVLDLSLNAYRYTATMIICFIELVCGQRHRSEVAWPVPLSTTQFYEAYDHDRNHDHMLHRTGLWTEAQVRGSKATRTCTSVNNPVLWSIWSWPQQTQVTRHATLDPEANFCVLNTNQEVAKWVKKLLKNIIKKKNTLV